jgi:hypothetical protein
MWPSPPPPTHHHPPAPVARQRALPAESGGISLTPFVAQRRAISCSPSFTLCTGMWTKPTPLHLSPPYPFPTDALAAQVQGRAARPSPPLDPRTSRPPARAMTSDSLSGDGDRDEARRRRGGGDEWDVVRGGQGRWQYASFPTPHVPHPASTSPAAPAQTPCMLCF